jgi:DNA-binding LytR/AlgR family response regulator
MESTTRILIVEDDMIIGANISLQLNKLGYEVIGIVSRGEEAIVQVKENPPDILLLDIHLKGKLNGIETAKAIQKFIDIPIIYLTANNDEHTFAMAKETHPRAFIAKPFDKLNFQRSIALVAEQLKENGKIARTQADLEILKDRVFVRHHGKMTKLLLDDILFIEADRNYCTIVGKNGSYMLSSTLKNMEEQLPRNHFLRVHRSFMVNISKLDVVGDHHLEINRKVIPLSKSHKELLMSRIHMI